MRKIKKVMDLLQVNWRTMAELEILYKVLSMTIFTPLFLWAFNEIMKVTGYQYLTIENIFFFFLNPLTLLLTKKAGCRSAVRETGNCMGSAYPICKDVRRSIWVILT